MRGSLTDFAALVATGLRGLWSRSLLTVGSVLLAMTAVAAAVVGPVYQSASAASYLVTKLRLEPDFLTGVTLDYIPAARTDLAGAVAQAQRAVPPSALSHFERPDLSLWTRRLPVNTLVFAQLDTEAELAAPPDCSALVVSGHCPTRPGEVLLLKFDAARTDTSVGDPIEVSGLRVPLTVVGTYRLSTRDNGRFADPSRWVSALPQAAARPTPYYPAPWVVAPATITSMKPRTWYVRMDYRLRVDPGTTLSDMQEAAREVSRLGAVERSQLPSGSVRAEEGGNALKSIVREVAQRQDTAQQTVTPAVLSLILVALVLLVRLLTAAMDLRRAELALASLRGIGRRQLWVLGLLEPVLMLAVAAPLGLAAGYLAAQALAAAWLVPGLPLRFGLSSVVFATGGLAAALAVATLTVRSALAEPLSAQIAGVRRPVRSSRWGLVVRLALIAAAVVVLAATLWSEGRSGPTVGNLLLPILLAGAAGVLTTLGAALTARWQATRSVRRRGLARYVAARAIARRREGTLAILPLTAALAIAVFAAGIYATAANWRASDAATQVGAEAAYEVQMPLEQALALTHEIDPDGRWLMAAAADADERGARVLVDAPRLARVAVWPDSWTPGMSAAEIGQALSPDRPALTLTGRHLEMTVDNGLDGDSAEILLTVEVVTSTGESRSILVGPFPPGTATRGGRMPCESGCQVSELEIGGPGPFAQVMRGTVAIRDVRTDDRPVPYFTGVGWWGNNMNTSVFGPASVTGVEMAGRSVRVELDSAGAATVARLTPGNVPSVLPVVVGRTTSLGVVRRPGAEVTVKTASGLDIRIKPVATTESTPFFGPAAMLVDLTSYTGTSSVSIALTRVYILARDDTPRSVTSALAEHGVSSPVRLDQVRHTLDNDAYALALNLYLVVTVLVILLALAGLAVNMAVQIPARRRDAASLRVVGLPRRSIVTSVTAELTAVLGAAAVAGILAGALSQYVVVRTITLGYAADHYTPRVLPSLDVPTVTALLASTFVLLLGVAVVLGNLTIRGARTATLRENVD